MLTELSRFRAVHATAAAGTGNARAGLAALLFLLSLLPALASAQFAGAIDDALLRDPPEDARYPAAVVELSIPSNGQRMPAHAYLAAGPGPHPTVVLLHGLPGNERNLDIAQALRRFGFNAVYFHYRGAWGAEGEYRFTQLADDALAVLAFLRDPDQAAQLRVDSAALTLLGHSVGGYTSLAAAARDPLLRCAISLSPANLGLWQTGIASGDANGQRLRNYADELYMLRGLTGERLFEELSAAGGRLPDTGDFGPGLRGKPVLMMVGEGDEVTPAATMFDPVVAAYRAQGDIDLSVKKLPGDHSFSESRIRLTREVLGWADTHCRAAP